jgi:hypothetical protein
MKGVLTMEVYYLDSNITDIDRHGSLCRCGLCNITGRSYGASFSLLNEEGWQAYANLIAGVDEDSFGDWCHEQESQATYYGPTESAAKANALRGAERDGWIVLNWSGYRTLLTNCMCESTGLWTPAQLSGLGLAFQPERARGPYPLTEEEARYISYNQEVQTPVGGAMFFGYTTLYRNRKWVAPLIEYGYADDAAPAEIAALLLKVRLEWLWLLEAVAPLGGVVHAFFDDPAPYRFELDVLVPLDVIAARFPDFESWLAHCRSLMLSTSR